MAELFAAAVPARCAQPARPHERIRRRPPGAHVFYTWTRPARRRAAGDRRRRGRALPTADGGALAGLRQHGLERQPRARPPGHARGAGRGRRARAAGDADVGVPGQGARRRAAGRGGAAPACARKVFFCLSGAEANENAVKMARLVTGRRKVVARTPQLPRRHAGDAVAVGRSAARARSSPGCPAAWAWTIRTASAARSASADVLRARCAHDLETVLLREGPDTVAAVLLEGVVGANGVFVPPPGYWQRVASSATAMACC